MSMQRTRGVRIVSVVVAALVILIAVPVIYVIRERQKSDRRLVNLLCETDHHALLRACRELSARAAAGGLKPMAYFVRRHPSAEVASFPKVILDVDPRFVRVEDDGSVWVVLYPIPSLAVIAYPENDRFFRDSRGDVELVPGLWFFDEQYRQDIYPQYVQYVDQLIEKGRLRVGDFGRDGVRPQ